MKRMLRIGFTALFTLSFVLLCGGPSRAQELAPTIDGTVEIDSTYSQYTIGSTNMTTIGGKLTVAATDVAVGDGQTLSVAGTGFLAINTVQDVLGKVTVASGGTLENLNTGEVLSGISNAGQIVFNEGSTYAGGGTLNNQGTIFLHTGMTGGSFANLATSLGTGGAGTIVVNGDLAVTDGLDFRNVGGGSFIVNDTQNTAIGQNVNVGGAGLELDGAGSQFGGDVAARSIVSKGENTTFNGAVTAGTIAARGENTSFNGAVTGNLLVDAATIIGTNGTVSGGSVTVAATKTLRNEGKITVANGDSLTGDGSVVNEGRITFNAGADYSGASLDNLAGTVELNTAMASGALGRLAAALGTVNVGAVQVNGALDNAGGLDFSSVGDGRFIFADTKTAADGYAVKLGGAEAAIRGAGSSFNDIQAGKITIEGADTALNGLVDGNLDVRANTSLGARAAFAGHDLTIKENAVLTNSGQATMSSGSTLAGKGDIVNRGDFTLKQGYVDNHEGMIVGDTGGVLGYDSALDLETLFAKTKLIGGALELDGTASLAGTSLALAAETSGGVVKTGQVTEFGGMHVQGAKLLVEADGTVFAGDVVSTNASEDAIATAGSTTFRGAVSGNLTTNAATVLDGGSALFANGDLRLSTTSVLTNNGGGIAMVSGRTMVLDGDIQNNGTDVSRGRMAFHKLSEFAVNEANTYIYNNRGGSITADAAMRNLSLLVSRIKMAGESEFNVLASENSSLAGDLNFAGLTGGRINFGSENGAVLTLDRDYSFSAGGGGSAAGINKGRVVLAAGRSLTASSFAIDSGASFSYAGGGSGRIVAPSSNINGDIEVASATGRLEFDGDLAFNGGSHIKLYAEGANIGKIATTGNHTVAIREGTSIAISGVSTDVLGAGAFIIAGDNAGNRVQGEQFLESVGDGSIASRYEFALDNDGNVYASGMKGTGNIIGDGDDDNDDDDDDDDDGNKDNGDKDDSDKDNGDKDGGNKDDGKDNGNKGDGDGNGGNTNGGDGDGSDTGNSINGGNTGSGSINKDNGFAYVDDLYGNVGADLDRNVGDYIDDVAGLGSRDRFNAFGQLIGEYGAVGRDAMVLSNDIFFKAVYNQMGLNQNYQGDALLLGDAGGPSGTAYANLSDAYYADGTARRNGICFDYREKAGKIWGGFLGGWSRQRENKKIPGYSYNSGGVILGYDRQIDRLNVGVAAAYTRAHNSVEGLGTKFYSDFVNFGLYGAYVHESGFFAKAGLGYGHGWNDYDVNLILGGKKEGKYKNDSFSANAEVGTVMCMFGTFNFIPSVGLRYTHLRQDGWSESLKSSTVKVANWFDKSRYNTVEVPLMARFNTTFNAGGVQIAPEVRAGWIFSAKKDRSHITTGFVGTGRSMTMYGVETGRNRLTLGAGVKVRFSANVDAVLDYNFEMRSRYRHHNLSATIGIAF